MKSVGVVQGGGPGVGSRAGNAVKVSTLSGAYIAPYSLWDHLT